MKQYQYYLFDWDGCLAKTLDVWFDAYSTAFASYGVHATNRQIATHFGDWQSPKYFGIADVQGCVKLISEIAAKNLQTVALYEGVEEMLAELANSEKQIALLSSSKRDVLLQGLRYNNIEKYFDVILAAEDVTEHKPSPEIIYKGLAALGGSKTQAVMIGDSNKDILAANNAGVDSILVYPSEHNVFYDLAELMRYGPTYVVDGIEALMPAQMALAGA